MKDGRYERQKQKMLDFKKSFSDHGPYASCLKYVIESEPEKYVVQCTDGCGGVARCGNPTLEEVKVVCSKRNQLHTKFKTNLFDTNNVWNICM